MGSEVRVSGTRLRCGAGGLLGGALVDLWEINSGTHTLCRTAIPSGWLVDCRLGAIGRGELGGGKETLTTIMNIRAA